MMVSILHTPITLRRFDGVKGTIVYKPQQRHRSAFTDRMKQGNPLVTLLAQGGYYI